MRNFKIDDVSCYDYKFILTDRKLRAIPEVNINEVDIGGMDGVVDGSFKFGRNTVNLTVECFDTPQNIYNTIRNFMNFLNPRKGYRKLIFDDEPNCVRYVRLINSSDIDYFYTQYLMFGKIDLEFKMADPFTYSTNIKRYYYNGVSGAVGKLMNNGGIECPIKIKVYPPKGIVTTKHEETDAQITYTGDWAVYSTQYCSGGSSKYSSMRGAYAQFTFTGTGLRIFGVKSAGKGKAKISIDGSDYGSHDCYAPSEEWKAKIFETIGLTHGTHVIRVEVDTVKNTSSVGYQVNLDYFEVVSSSIPPNVLPMPITGGTFSHETVPPITNPKININKEYVKYKGTLNSTDELIINTKEFSFELNGYSDLKKWEGDFPKLDIGENTIIQIDDTAKGALIIFEFIERWL